LIKRTQGCFQGRNVGVGISDDPDLSHLFTVAALRALDQAGCDSVMHTGDAIGLGPHPAECLEVLVDRPSTQLSVSKSSWIGPALS